MANPFIMLVDDEAPFVETMTKRLAKRELEVITALSGDEGVEKLGNNKNLDVVILDVKMPGMDGLEALQEMKRKAPLTEVIMLTGHATVESAIEGMKLGAFDYLMKPCDIDILVTKTLQATGKKRDHEEKIREAAVREALVTHGS